jgi:hypothetical protein
MEKDKITCSQQSAEVFSDADLNALNFSCDWNFTNIDLKSIYLAPGPAVDDDSE